MENAKSRMNVCDTNRINCHFEFGKNFYLLFNVQLLGKMLSSLKNPNSKKISTNKKTILNCRLCMADWSRPHAGPPHGGQHHLPEPQLREPQDQDCCTGDPGGHVPRARGSQV